jgi:hypothetical protein
MDSGSDSRLPRTPAKSDRRTALRGAPTSLPGWLKMLNGCDPSCLQRPNSGRSAGKTTCSATKRPSPQQKRDLMQSISTAIRTVLDIDRHDRQTDADSAVDQFLARLKDGAQ